jgi:pullulanase
MMDWWRGLINLRLSPAGAVFRQPGAVPEGYYRFLTPDDERALGYVVDDRVLVLVNSGDAEATFDLGTASGAGWRLVAESDRETSRIDPAGVEGTAPAGSETLGPQSVRIWVRR